MITINIKSITGTILFTHTCDDNNLKLTVEKAVEEGTKLIGANLWGANLGGANLKGADLKGANLWGADLYGANLWNVKGDQTYIKNIDTPTYNVCYTSDRLQVGCKDYSFEEWLSFSDQEIEAMDSGALSFWKENKDKVFDEIEANPAK